ncbi:MAG: hypothetical protein ACD_65C00243G0002 [uncultured bacterium]|nr:MAG: hypothetical protein ACD_65C00243G0002 [uncultured bacterium]KKT01889.1 MAG: hypothetical protein UV80_C0007G0003 [Candidatus Peregrinibacteria bacterium GW2011_GWF2_43_17]
MTGKTTGSCFILLSLKQKQNMDPNIKKFLTDLIKEAGMGALPQADQDKMIDELYVRLEDRLMLAVMEALPDQKRVDFQAKIETDEMDAKQVEDYIRQNVPNYEQVFAKAFAEFRELYLSAVGE